jgi:fatty acid desaturase
MEWISRVVVGGVAEVMSAARSRYGVDPIIFLVIYFGSVPFFYYSIFRMARAMLQRRQNDIITWSTVFLASTVAPFLYVLFFGRNLPWWVYLVVALLIGQGVYSLVRRLRRKAPAAEAEKETPRSG